MLKLKNIIDCVPISIEIDPYIALAINFDSCDPSIEPTAYWRTGNLDSELVEIGVSNERGMLRKITVILIQKIKLQVNDYSKIDCKNGIPIFRKIKYDKNLLFDEKGPIEMFIGQDKLQFLFSHNEVTFGLVCDRVICLFDAEKDFCGFEVTNISDEEMKILKENFIDRLK